MCETNGRKKACGDFFRQPFFIYTGFTCNCSFTLFESTLLYPLYLI